MANLSRADKKCAFAILNIMPIQKKKKSRSCFYVTFIFHTLYARFVISYDKVVFEESEKSKKNMLSCCGTFSLRQVSTFL